MTDHPITPPPELVQQWWAEETYDPFGVAISRLATQAANWGWDQRNETIEAELQEARDVELEACCALIQRDYPNIDANALRAARRPKPLSLKAQALGALKNSPVDPADETLQLSADAELIIRRALEALDD